LPSFILGVGGFLELVQSIVRKPLPRGLLIVLLALLAWAIFLGLFALVAAIFVTVIS